MAQRPGKLVTPHRCNFDGDLGSEAGEKICDRQVSSLLLWTCSEFDNWVHFCALTPLQHCSPAPPNTAATRTPTHMLVGAQRDSHSAAKVVLLVVERYSRQQ